MAAPSQQQNPGQMGVIWIIVGIFVLLFGVWYFFHTQIVTGYFFVKKYEIDFIQFFIKGFESPALENVRQIIASTSPSAVSFNELSTVANVVGDYLRFPFAIILIVFSIILFYKSAATRFKTVYNMQSFLKAESETWTQDTPVLGLDLIGTDIEKGPWAMAMAPMHFAKKYKLLKEYWKTPETGGIYRKEILAVSLIRERAARVFTLQLGRSWQGVDALNDHTKALFAAFAASAGRNIEASWKLFGQLSSSSRYGKLNYTDVDELLKKYQNHPEVIEVTKKHAYVYTVMASMLMLARSSGVLSSADFLWLKPKDRRLWFMLNAVGRQTPTVEVAGPYAHWIAEMELGRKINTPMVEEAINGLDVAIQELVYHSDKE